MKVYKFGGASVKDGSGIRNLAGIATESNDNLVIVVSAFGKTTNALEKVLNAWLDRDSSYLNMLDEIYLYHLSVINELFAGKSAVEISISDSFGTLKEYFSAGIRRGYDFEYDQVVSFGELWSTIIVAGFLKTVIPDSEWIDIRKNLITDERFRDANIIWDESETRLRSTFNFANKRIYVTQGFIGATLSGLVTTLGREGSDYTAAIIANMMDAECAIVWKDVSGILNADPQWLPDAKKLDEISYKEAVEMSFSGAKVIHPKTIKPLHNKNIPLYVRSFLNPGGEGTVIKADAILREVMPVFVRKEDQILISILPRDFSFVIGDNLSRIFHTFLLYGIKVNLVEASAVSIDVCIDNERPKVDALLMELSTDFLTAYNENVEMLSIRHYTAEAIVQITKDREILIEQRTRSTVRFVVKKV